MIAGTGQKLMVALEMSDGSVKTTDDVLAVSFPGQGHTPSDAPTDCFVIEEIGGVVTAFSAHAVRRITVTRIQA